MDTRRDGESFVNIGEHIPAEVLFGFEHRLLAPGEVLRVQEHIDTCEVCRQLLAERMALSGMEADIRASLDREELAAPGPWLSRRLILSAAAAVLVAVAILPWLVRRHAVPDNPAVAEALRNGRIETPAFVADLIPRRGVLMGGTGTVGAGPMSPSGTAVLSWRPTFTWPALTGGWSYKIRVYRLDGTLSQESGDLVTTSWTSTSDLAPGETYQWQVTAAREDERRTLPVPPERPPRFRIADVTSAQRLQQLVKAKASHLELAVEYGRSGLLPEARREMEATVAEHPDDPRLRQLLSSLTIR